MKTGFCSERVLYLVAQLSALTIHTAYAAFLISCLTVHKFSLPFDSLRELIDIGTYRLGVLANSGQLNIFNVSHVIFLATVAKDVNKDVFCSQGSNCNAGLRK